MNNIQNLTLILWSKDTRSGTSRVGRVASNKTHSSAYEAHKRHSSMVLITKSLRITHLFHSMTLTQYLITCSCVVSFPRLHSAGKKVHHMLVHRAVSMKMCHLQKPYISDFSIKLCFADILRRRGNN